MSSVPDARDFAYQGTELDVFRHALHWKRRLRRELVDCVGGDVLEVGAGIGATTLVLRQLDHRSWTCLEPDSDLARRLGENLHRNGTEPLLVAESGTVAELPTGRRYDTILYIDVLEHIDDDRGELAAAATHLRPWGHLIVVAPAHQWLYTSFDRAIGHHRRYTRASLLAVTPAGVHLVRARYLDSVGLLASLTNRILLRSSSPSKEQILIWDRYMVRISRWLDPLVGYRVGKSILAVWRA